MRIARPLHLSIDVAIDDQQRVEMDDVHFSVGVLPGRVFDLLVPFFEEGAVGGPVAPSVAVGCDRNARVVRRVRRKVLEPGLRKVPQGYGTIATAKCCIVCVLTRLSAD